MRDYERLFHAHWMRRIREYVEAYRKHVGDQSRAFYAGMARNLLGTARLDRGFFGRLPV